MSNDKMIQALADIEQTALIDLWELDLRTLGGQQYFYCNYSASEGKALVWKGKRYEPYPIKADGFEVAATGSSNRPKLTVANVLGVITGLAAEFNQLVGAVVIRRQTYAKFLDAVNFSQGNAEADPAQEVVSKYVIEQLTALNVETATFTLAAPSESDGSVIPARIMLANICPFEYRGEGCGYTGHAVADRYDMPTSDPSKDQCSRSLMGCRARFGQNACLPFGGGPSLDKVT